ncbi:terminase small subunit [Dyella sp. 2RAF44]|uniref:terminase small subunit n=1 Tax=Dyella sp. 2RAF44 TaxID=3233000 RepID=UPI003F8FF902
MQKLTAKQSCFVDEYLVDLNATQAAVRAGYSPHSADKIGSQLLGKTGVQTAIHARQSELRERVHIQQEQVLLALAAIAFADIADYVEEDEAGSRLRPLSSLSPVKRSALAEAKQHKNGFRLRLHSKLKALDLLAKHLGMYQ